MVLPIWLIIGQAIKQSISNQESVACHDEGNNGSLLIKGHLLARESKAQALSAVDIRARAPYLFLLSSGHVEGAFVVGTILVLNISHDRIHEQPNQRHRSVLDG